MLTVNLFLRLLVFSFCRLLICSCFVSFSSWQERTCFHHKNISVLEIHLKYICARDPSVWEICLKVFSHIMCPIAPSLSPQQLPPRCHQRFADGWTWTALRQPGIHGKCSCLFLKALNGVYKDESQRNGNYNSLFIFKLWRLAFWALLREQRDFQRCETPATPFYLPRWRPLNTGGCLHSLPGPLASAVFSDFEYFSSPTVPELFIWI